MSSPVESPVTGTVWKIEAEVGDRVEPGDVIMILESMKMEIPVEVEVHGHITSIEVAETEPVTEGDALAIVS